MQRSLRIFIALILLTLILVIIDLPENFRVNVQLLGIKIDRVINPPTIDVKVFGTRVFKEFRTHLGLDLSGGSHIALEADMSSVSESARLEALESAKQVIERRVNFFGVSEPLVQTVQGNGYYRVIVELPGVTDMEQAVHLIGQTAQLEFREFTDLLDATASGFFFPTLTNTVSVGVTGKDLEKAQLTFSANTGEPEVAIFFTSEGAKKFGEVTTRLVGKNLAIFLDEQPLTWPTVSTPITDGNGVISGKFSRDEAKNLALQINAGALPVPVHVIEKRTVGATLGQESVNKSVRAGLLGLIIVMVFMILKYGALGVFADMALLLYGLLTFALFRFIPITLTLPGIAGFLLSVGMAVDGNILIFERMKEELRKGKPKDIAMEIGFGKAWDSIRDANITTLLTCFILYNPGNWNFLPNSGMVRGFAITLFIGVLTSLFTGIVATRTFMRVLYKEKRKI